MTASAFFKSQHYYDPLMYRKLLVHHKTTIAYIIEMPSIKFRYYKRQDLYHYSNSTCNMYCQRLCADVQSACTNFFKAFYIKEVRSTVWIAPSPKAEGVYVLLFFNYTKSWAGGDNKFLWNISHHAFLWYYSLKRCTGFHPSPVLFPYMMSSDACNCISHNVWCFFQQLLLLYIYV
jgi:hypothetical protein